MPTKNMLTTKECPIVEDLLTLEELAVKKARVFSRTLTNQKLCDLLKELSKNHEQRYLRLYALLGE